MPVLLDYVQRDGRVAEREVRSELEVPLPPLDEVLDAYSLHQRRVQLVEALYETAKRSNARWLTLHRVPLLRPLAVASYSLRRAQLWLSAVLTFLVSFGVAPHSGCGVACWAAESAGFLYTGLAFLLLVDGAAESDDIFALFYPSSWLRLLGGAPTPMLRQLALLGVSLGALISHPYFFLLTCLDLLPAIPRCRGLLRPLSKAAPPVLAIAALAAALALPAAAAARATGAIGECAAGDAAACAVQALAILAPATTRGAAAAGSSAASSAAKAVAPAGGRGDSDRGGDVRDDSTTLSTITSASASEDAAVEAASNLGANTLSQLGPLLLLALGALLLQLGVAILVDALADQRSRTLATHEYASEHCLVCGASRAELDKLGVRGFELHVRKTHNPEAYARLLADAASRKPAQRTDDDRWLIDCAERRDPDFLPTAGREYYDGPGASPGSIGSLAALGGGSAGAAGGHGVGVGWRPAGWEPGSESALGWKLSSEPTNAQLRAAVEQLAVEGARCAAELRKLGRQDGANAAAGGSGNGTMQPLAALSVPPPAAAAARIPEGGSSKEWAAFAERLSALERASRLQAEQTGHATREASRVATELHHRFATAHDTASAVSDLTRLVTASSATIERVIDEVDALRTACGLTVTRVAAPAPAPAGSSRRRELSLGANRTTFNA